MREHCYDIKYFTNEICLADADSLVEKSELLDTRKRTLDVHACACN